MKSGPNDLGNQIRVADSKQPPVDRLSGPLPQDIIRSPSISAILQIVHLIMPIKHEQKAKAGEIFQSKFSIRLPDFFNGQQRVALIFGKSAEGLV